MSHDIRYEASPPIARLEFHRPQHRNAITSAMWDVLADRLAAFAADPSLKAMVISGAGGAFAAGAEIGEFADTFKDEPSADAYDRRMEVALSRLWNGRKPTIARISGPAVGAGCGVAVACDFRLATKDSMIGLPPARLGIVYPFDQTKRLVNLIGPAQAKRLLFTGRLIDADEAHAIGLVDAVAPDDAALDAMVDEWAATMATNAQSAIQGMNRMVQLVLDGVTEENDEARRLFLDSVASDDFREGYRAFLERRKPSFP